MAAVIVIVISTGVSSSASAYWAATSAPGGAGAAASATVNPGARPTVTAGTRSASLTWPAVTLSSGAAVSGYLVARYSSPALTTQIVGNGCAGVIAATGCTETEVPKGQWVYSVTPVVAVNWRGAESVRSSAITVANSAPVVSADTYSVLENSTLTVPAPGVMANDSDPDGDAVSAVLGVGPANGTLSFAADGGFIYTPKLDFIGPDSFTYSANDAAAGSPTVTVAITVTARNFALTGTPSSSSSFVASGWSLPHLTDGNVVSAGSHLGWTSGSGASGFNHTEWAQVDLGVARYLAHVDLYPRSDAPSAGHGFPVDFTIAVSNNGFTWTPVVTRTAFPLPAAGAQRFSFPTVSARYVRVTGTNLRPNPFDANRYWMQFADLQVFGPTNLATGSIATANSTVESGVWSLKGANDNTLANGWSSGEAGAAVNHTEWVQLDTRSAIAISEVDVYPRLDTGNVGRGYPVDFVIATSNDGSTWNAVVTLTAQAMPTTVQSFAFATTTARYVRITGTSLRANPNDGGKFRMQFAEVMLR